MRRHHSFAIVAIVLFAATAAFAQGTSQTVELTKIDVVQVANGYRASKVIGENVVNDANETVGKVDDIIIAPDGKAAFVVLSVGGFLGVGSKYVALPYSSMKVMNGKLTMLGATKDALKALPEFKYKSR
jgi:sporulation protein YlmC with PRC-barrel domain